MPRMTGGRAAVEMLVRNGVDTLFTLPGVQLDGLFNALHDAAQEGRGLRVIHTRHEQAAAYMAYGYAKATGRPGAYAAVPGPGVLNTTAALATAYAANAPVLCLAGQIDTAAIGKGLGALHETPDQLGILQRLTKWAARADQIWQIPHLVNEAFYQLRSGRPRPVALELPMDVLVRDSEVVLDDALPVARPAPDPQAVARAAELLVSARRPLIMIGSGADDAGAALLALAEWLQAPVCSNTSGRGVIDDRHALSVTGPVGHRLWADADVVLAVGTRLQRPLQQWGTDASLRLIRVDVDAAEIGRIQPPTVAIQADAGLALEALCAHVRQAGGASRADRAAEIAALKAELERAYAELPHYAILRAIREALPDDAIFVDEMTQVGYASRYAWKAYGPRSVISAHYQGTLGHGYGTALGAKVAHPDRPVVAIAGDGGFMFQVQELATAVQHGIGVIAIVFNDGAFGNVRRMQKENHGGRLIASDLRNPDFVKLAEAFGMPAARVTSADALGAAVRDGVARGGPMLIEMPVGEMPEPRRFTNLPRVRPPKQPENLV